jgi:peptide/nickel transport system permease protein
MRRPSALSQLLASGPGRLGVAAFALLAGLSLYVALTYPLDFGPARWSNPAVWADYPRTVPPAWTNRWGDARKPVHQIVESDAPVSSEPFGPGEVRRYELAFEHRADEPPTLLSFTLSGVTYDRRPPQYALVLHRPDGTSVPLAREVVSGPRPGERGPFARHADTPLRLLLSSTPGLPEALATTFAERYGDTVSAATFRSRPLEALFGVPASAGGSAPGGGAPGALAPLRGRYVLEARFTVADPADAVASLRAVVGGAVYGAFGTDALGRDLAEGLLFGLPIALVIGLLASTLSTAVGTAFGLVSGFMGGRVDLVIQRVADVIANVPVLPLLIFLVFILGSKLWLILLILVAFSWPGLTILVRSMVLPLRASQEVEAARTLGASTAHIIWRHVFPHTAPFVFAQLIFFAPGAILAEAGLSFLGLGDPSLPTWGQILEHGFRTGAVFLGYWWWVVPPGLLIVLTAIVFMLLALGMETVVNPRLRKP